MRSCLGVLRSEVTAGVAETLLTYLLTPVQGSLFCWSVLNPPFGHSQCQSLQLLEETRHYLKVKR